MLGFGLMLRLGLGLGVRIRVRVRVRVRVKARVRVRVRVTFHTASQWAPMRAEGRSCFRSISASALPLTPECPC